MTTTIHDLSHPILDGMMAYPGDPRVSIREALALDIDGAVVERVEMGSHTGTHLDAPSHTVRDGRTMARVSLEELVGEAIILRVPGAREAERYGWADVAVDGGIPDVLPPIVIIDTGWARWFGTSRALRHPYLDAAAAAELQRRGMRILAVDTLSPDPTGDPGAELAVHQVILGADGLIVENICRLEGLPPRVQVGLFPLALQGDGAPIRAVAFVNGVARPARES